VSNKAATEVGNRVVTASLFQRTKKGTDTPGIYPAYGHQATDCPEEVAVARFLFWVTAL
jgi:hypothetical protein